MVKSDLAKSTVGVDLVSVLMALDLHLALKVLTELEDIPLLGHDLVGEGAASDDWLVVLLHVEPHEVGALLLHSLRVLADRLHLLLQLLKSSLRRRGRVGELGCGLWSRLLLLLFGLAARELRTRGAGLDAATVAVLICVLEVLCLRELSRSLLSRLNCLQLRLSNGLGRSNGLRHDRFLILKASGNPLSSVALELVHLPLSRVDLSLHLLKSLLQVVGRVSWSLPGVKETL